MIYNENRATGLRIRLPFFFLFCFVVWFLRIISESAGERGLMFLGIDNGDNSITTMTLFRFILRWLWTCFFRVFRLKVILVFINIVCVLSLSDASVIESLLLTLSRWQSFTRKPEHFLIQNTFQQPPLVWLLVTSTMNR